MPKSNKGIYGIVAAILLVVVGAGAWLVFGNNANNDTDLTNDPPISSDITCTKVDSQTITYQGIEGKTALAILKECFGNGVVTTEYPGMGEFVDSIDGIVPSETQFWAFYVNGEMSMEGASTFVTGNDDQIKWQLDSIENF